jgi:hypothetical protein
MGGSGRQRQAHTFFPLTTTQTSLQGGLQTGRELTAFQLCCARAASGRESAGIKTKMVRPRNNLAIVNRFMPFPFFSMVDLIFQ